MMKKIKYLFWILTASLLAACSEEVAVDENKDDPATEVVSEILVDTITDTLLPIPILMAEVDLEAMNEISSQYGSGEMTTIEIYNQPIDEVEKWSDKLWGRCCTEADMTFAEHLSYALSASHEGKDYPFEYATDEYYNTAYVFEEKDHISIKVRFNPEVYMQDSKNQPVISVIDVKDTIVSPFRITLINGYVKSENTYSENGRIKEVELWLNGVHRSNCMLMDSPDAQVIVGDFSFFKNDVVEIKPVAFYPGTKYDDICVSVFQESLSTTAHPLLNKKYTIWGE